MRVTRVIAGSTALLAGLATFAGAQSFDRARPYDQQVQTSEAPAVDLWLDQLDFSFGERIRPFFASEANAYVTIVRVTTDGELRILYPRRPSDQRSLPNGTLANDQVPSGDDRGFRLYESSGTGFVFAIASYQRFDFRYFTSGSQWSIARLASSRYGDPFAIVDQFITRTLGTRAEFSLDYMSYQVAGRSYARSRYASNFRSYTLYDYYERCLSSFSLRSSYYCNQDDGYYDSYAGYYGRYRGPIVISRPTTPRNPAATPRAGMRPRPLTPDPMVPASPLPSAAEGRLGTSDDRREDAAMRAAARREHDMRRERPSIRTAPRDENYPAPRVDAPRVDGPRVIDREPRIEPRAQPRFEPPVQSNAEPRVESRPEPRAEPQVERRSEPRVESQPAPAPAPAPQVERPPPPLADAPPTTEL